MPLPWCYHTLCAREPGQLVWAMGVVENLEKETRKGRDGIPRVTLVPWLPVITSHYLPVTAVCSSWVMVRELGLGMVRVSSHNLQPRRG